MAQLRTLIWLKWKLFRNALRSRKAQLNQVASILGTLAALAFSLLVALGLGFAAYFISSQGVIRQVRHASAGAIPPPSFIFFIIFAFLYMLWATLPLSIGGGSQFEPGRLLMYPISLKKLFVVDLLSELTSLSSVFAVPAILSIAIGAGLATNAMAKTLFAAAIAIVLGVALAKWLTTAIGALMKRRRTRGETILALVGAVAGLSGALMGQLWPVIVRHSEWFEALRFTPPGAVAVAMSEGLEKGNNNVYIMAILLLVGYSLLLILATYWVAERAVLGKGERRRKSVTPPAVIENYSGWRLPLVSPDLSAVIEKEARYALRNAQLRMIALMPLILLAVRFMNSRRFDRTGSFAAESGRVNDFFYYGNGLMATAGVLYVFLILAGIACNSFGFDGGGMRTLILSPIERRKVLIGKNLVIVAVCLVFSLALLVVNQLVFWDLTPATLLFVLLSFIIFGATISMVGNWLSVRFPKRMKFGKRLNVSGVAGLLLLPMMFLMALPPLAATAAGFLGRSLLLEYVTLAAFALTALLLYFPVVRMQGRSLERHERELLDVVSREFED